MEGGDRIPNPDLEQRIQGFWIGIGVVAVLVLALALWSAGLLRGATRTQDSLERARASLDSLRWAQAEQLARQREIAARLVALDRLESELRDKADADQVTRLRGQVERVSREIARLDTARAVPPRRPDS